MNIELHKISIAELVDGFEDDGDGGVRGYGGQLDIRPPYQREFVYGEKKRNAVIDTVRKGFPLNVMYWAVRADGTYEIIDGQQRTVSIAQFWGGAFSVDDKYFQTLEEDQRQEFLDYTLQIYFCEGTPSEKLEWFEIVNIAGEKLELQELRNAAYYGPWVTDAKNYFSRPNCPAKGLAGKYVKGRPIRQELFEKAIIWAKDKDQSIENFMNDHREDKTATDLWNHFQASINRIEAVFPYYRREMKSVDWGALLDLLQDNSLDPEALEERVKELMADEEVENKQGIYPFLLTGEEKHLSLRQFSDGQKRTMFERQNGICTRCEEQFEIGEMEGDHIIPWTSGGKTDLDNGQMLCRSCNRKKSDS